LGAALQADGGNEVRDDGLKHQKEKRSMDHFCWIGRFGQGDQRTAAVVGVVILGGTRNQQPSLNTRSMYTPFTS
jgi:hypothetical protein